MPAPKRAVQTPGAAPADTSADQEQGATLESLEGEAVKVVEGLTAADYATMHSSQVDATKLKRSVLCKDGWVVPDLPPQAPVRA